MGRRKPARRPPHRRPRPGGSPRPRRAPAGRPAPAGAIIALLGWTAVLALTAWSLLATTYGDHLSVVRTGRALEPWLALSAGLLLCLLLAARRRWPAVALLAVALPLGLSAAENVALVPRALAGRHADLKVVTFNVSRGNTANLAIAGLLASTPADLYVLQEVTDGPGLAAAIAARPALAGYHIVIQPTAEQLVASRFPIDGETRDLGTIVGYRVHTPQGPLAVWNAHLMRANMSARRHDWQVRELFARILAEPGPKLVAGDFNTTRRNDDFALIGRHLREAHVSVGQGPAFTYPTPALPLGRLTGLVKIDHVFYSAPLEAVLSRRVEGYAGSEHYPMLAGFAWRG